jgi:ABC-type arginine/histidine transport system permease subunit
VLRGTPLLVRLFILACGLLVETYVARLGCCSKPGFARGWPSPLNSAYTTEMLPVPCVPPIGGGGQPAVSA